MSSNIALHHQDFTQAVEFYSNVLGFNNNSNDPNMAEYNTDPINIYILEGAEIKGPVLELFVNDLEEAREFLIANGCEVLRWRGKGQDCYIQDPFGVIYNLWED